MDTHVGAAADSSVEPAERLEIIKADAGLNSEGEGLTGVRRIVSSLDNAITTVVEVILGIALLSQLGVVFADVITRNFFGFSILWTDEFAQLTVGVLAFVGGAFAFRQGKHVGLQIIIRKLPVSWAGVQQAFANFAVISIAAIIGWEAIQLSRGQWAGKLPYLGLSEAWITIPVAVGMFITAAYATLRLLESKIQDLWKGSLGLVAAVILEFAFSALAHHLGSSVDLSDIISIATFFLLLILGIPIAFVLMTTATLYLFNSGTAPLTASPLNMTNGVSDVLLVAVPFFIFTGLILAHSGLSARLLRWIEAIIGGKPGGMLHAVVVAMYLFSGISGSKVADVAAVGAAVVEPAEKQGYSRERVAAVLAASAVMGESVPPSIAIIIFGSVTNISVIGLFLAGIIPAAALGLLLMVVTYLQFRKLGNSGKKVVWRDVFHTTGPALPVLCVPIFLAYGIISGFASPTEISAIAVVATLLLTVGYRTMSRHTFRVTLRETLATAGFVLLIIGAASDFAWSFTVSGLPQDIANLAGKVGDSRIAILAATLVIVPIMGAFLEGIPAILLFAPLLLPAATAAGVDPLQYGIIFVVGMGLGSFSPPLGAGLFATCGVCGTTMEKVSPHLKFYWAVLFGGLIILAAFPSIANWLPHLIQS